MPQENGNRCDVRWFALQSDKAGVMIVGDEPLSVSVWEMSQNAIDKAKHINELEKDLYSNTLNIDLVQAGVGGTDSWSLKARPSIDKRLLKGSYSYGFTFVPLGCWSLGMDSNSHFSLKYLVNLFPPPLFK